MVTASQALAPLPPQNLDAEESVLGAMMLSSTAIEAVNDILDAGDFYRESHAKIFRAALELYQHGQPVDAITIADKLDELGQLDEVGGKERIHEIAALVPATSNAAHYAKIVREMATLRGLTLVGEQIQRLGWDRPGETPELVDRAEQMVFDLAQHRIRGSFEHVEALVRESFEQITRMYESGGEMTGTPTGFRDVDSMTSGLQPGNLVVIAGRPSMGKSAFALGIASNLALHHDTPVAIFTLEMSKLEVAQRLMCSEGRVELQRLRTGRLTSEDWTRLVKACDALTKAPIYVDDTRLTTMLEIRAKARRLKAQQPKLGLVIVDYLQLMSSGNDAENRVQEVSQISRSLKVIAGDLEVPVVALSQLSRAVESRTDKRPLLSDLRECVVGDTRVVLADGRRLPIRELVGSAPEVLAVYDGRIVPAASDKVWRVGERPVFDVVLASGRRIRATEQHRLLAREGWTRVKDLRVGSRLALARRLPEPEPAVEWSDERVALLAQLIRDGSDRTAGSAQSAHRRHRAAPDSWLRELGVQGQQVQQRRLPAEAFRLGNRQVALLLRQLGRGDEETRVFSATASRGLAEDVAALLLRLSIVARIVQVGGNEHVWFTVELSEADRRRLAEAAAAAGSPDPEAAHREATPEPAHATTGAAPTERELVALAGPPGRSRRTLVRRRVRSSAVTTRFQFAPSRALVQAYTTKEPDPARTRHGAPDLVWDPVVSIDAAGTELVYDLTVPGPASWLADGIVSHNSGAIEQDSDLVMFLYRDEYYNENSEDQGLAEVILAKHRNGPIGTEKLAFLKRFAKFSDLASQHDSRAAA